MRGVLPCEGLLLKGYVWDFDLGFGYLVWDLVFATLFYWITTNKNGGFQRASSE